MHVLLIGGGHSHVAVLADWARHGFPAQATLLTPDKSLRYSGMVPGWISGQHKVTDGLVDLAALAAKAGVELVLDRCVGIDPRRMIVTTLAGREIAFDIASVNAGGVGRARDILGDDPRVIDVRPINGFVEALDARRRNQPNSLNNIAVVGGGAGGVELAFALRNWDDLPVAPRVTLVTGRDGLIPDFASPVRRKVARALAAQGISCVEGDASIESGRLMAGGQALEPIDTIIAALGSAAPDWLHDTGLALDANGFVAVDRHQRSVSHPHVLAVGDIAARQDRRVPHSGVHAVHAGPIMSKNLRALAGGREPTASYRPRPTSLYLLSTGDGSAIGSYGPLALKGRWVARLKSWIDKGWIASYAAEQ